MHKNVILWMLACCIVFAGCTPGSTVQMIARLPLQEKRQTVTVFAAASLTESFTEIARRFEGENPGVSITLNFAGSQQLAQQLVHGAPADVFASANQKQMQIVIDAGSDQHLTDESVKIFAANRLVIITPQDNPAQIHQIIDLSKPGLKLVVADGAVPVGLYTQIFLENALHEPTLGPAFINGMVSNIVSYENSVRAVLSKVILGEADAGIVYSSDVAANRDGLIGRLPIPNHLNTTASYYITALKDDSHNQAAQAFIKAVLSAQGQAILAEYGFLPAP